MKKLLPVTYPMRPCSGADFCRSDLQRDGRFAAEPKINGIRLFADLDTQTVWNRHGAILTDGHKYVEALAYLRSVLPPEVRWIDCESLGRYTGQDRVLFVFDIVSDQPYSDRRAILEAALPVWNPDVQSGLAVIVPSGEPATMWNWCLELQKRYGEKGLMEGIVLKRKDSPYEVQLVSTTRETRKWVKFRFEWSSKTPVAA